MLPISAKDVLEFIPPGSDVTYRCKVPTHATRAAVGRDMMASGVRVRGNDELLSALLSAADSGILSSADAAFVRGNAGSAATGGDFAPNAWGRIFDIASGVPMASEIIADRIYRSDLEQIQVVRHHILIPTKPSPAPISALNDIDRDHIDFLASKLREAMTVSKDQAKN